MTFWPTKIKQMLYKPIFRKKKNVGDERLGELPKGEHAMTVNQDFLNDFLKDAREGRKWCEEAAMHWAEVLTFPFSKMIITFDLGVLAFIGVMRESFFNQTLLVLSIVYAVGSLLILSIFTRNVIVKNINSLAERKRVLNYTIMLAPPQGVRTQEDGQNVVSLMKKQGKDLKTNLDGLEEHVKIWMPWQKIGVYLFYASVVSVLAGIIL